MGVPVNSIRLFEENVRHSRKFWTMIIFVNAASDSRAVEYVIRNFHEMDTISDDVNFFLPGYCLQDFQKTNICNDLDWRNILLAEEYQDYHGIDNDTQGILSVDRKRRKFVRVIDSPRLGPITFNEAEFTDFIMELNRKNRSYRYMGTCQMNVLPILDGVPDYSRIRSYDLDAIVDCPSGPSLDSFFHHVVHIIRGARPCSRLSLFERLLGRRDNVFGNIDRIYEEATMFRNDEKYEIIINNVIVDMEKCLQWSLKEEYFFISYSSKNVLKATMIGKLLQERGKHVWIAPDGIPQGREYSLVVPTALRMAKHFVLLLTPDSARSNWVKRELDIAVSNDANTRIKVLLADGFRIDDIRRNNELMFYLNRVQIKYEYDDVIRNFDLLDRFISE